MILAWAKGRFKFPVLQSALIATTRLSAFVMFVLIGAATIYAGDYRWETWRLISARNSRVNLLLAKSGTTILPGNTVSDSGSGSSFTLSSAVNYSMYAALLNESGYGNGIYTEDITGGTGDTQDFQLTFAHLAEGPIDVVLIDINLGHGLSFDFARTLKAQTIPFVFLTGYDAAMLPEDLATSAYLSKPADAARVAATDETIPPPARAISSYVAPPSRCSNSAERSPPNTRWVCMFSGAGTGCR